MRCPYCGFDSADGPRCTLCSAPFAIPDDWIAPAMDRAIDLDRRRSHRPAPADAAGALEPYAGAWEESAFAPGPVDVEVSDDAGEADDVGEAAVMQLTSAPLERRVGAWAIDAGVVALATAVPALLALLQPGVAHVGGAALAFAGLAAFAYRALGHALMSATFGQRAFGLRVIGPDGGPPGLARSGARAALAVLGTAALGAGLMPAIFTRSGRGLHDRWARTVVVLEP
jgi:uncharacterized RDD family membrane protein YckC